MKDERIRWALRWFRWRFRRNGWGNWTPEKKRWKHLKLEFIQQEQNPKKRNNHLVEIRIRFIVCLSFIKLNWWQAMDFSYYLFFLKRIKRGIAQNLRKSSWTTGRIRKNEWIKNDNEGSEILNEPPLEFGNDWQKRMNHREELEKPICSRGFRCKRTKRSWAD